MYYTPCLLPPILHNPVSCGADGFLGDAHDATHGLVVHAHFVEDEEEGVVGGLGGVFLLDAAVDPENLLLGGKSWNDEEAEN